MLLTPELQLLYLCLHALVTFCPLNLSWAKNIELKSPAFLFLFCFVSTLCYRSNPGSLTCKATALSSGCYHFKFWDRVSLSCPGWSQTSNLPVSASCVVGLQECTIISGLWPSLYSSLYLLDFCYIRITWFGSMAEHLPQPKFPVIWELYYLVLWY